MANQNRGDKNDEENDSIFNIQKHLKYILSQNVSMNLSHDDESCIEEASKLFGEDIKTWDEKMYYYFGSKDNVSLDNLSIYDDQEFRNSLINKGVDEFSEYEKILDSECSNVTSDREFIGATYEDNPDGKDQNNDLLHSEGAHLEKEREKANYEENYASGKTKQKPNSEGEHVPGNPESMDSEQQDGCLDDIEKYINTFVNDEADDEGNEQRNEDETCQRGKYDGREENEQEVYTQEWGERLDLRVKRENGEEKRRGRNREEISQGIHGENSEDIAVGANSLKPNGAPDSGETKSEKEEAGSLNDGEINIDDIVNKAINIGNIFRKREITKLQKMKKSENSTSSIDITRSSASDKDEFPVREALYKPLLKKNKTTRLDEKGSSHELGENEGEEENCKETFKNDTKRDEQEELKAYRNASYEVRLLSA
ncbi:conserved Plasmodium protein, unknown function [Plasmodium ovale wallikeri]|nr:conserved Plasmodium protein, unknown function [Plasmodium ovale wallikeri]